MKTLFIAVLLTVCYCVSANAKTLDTQIPDEKAIKAIIGEAENQGYEGMYALACAIRNRGTLKGVYGLKAPRVRKQLYTKQSYEQARKAWINSATGDDPTMGANHWENVKAFGVPYWAVGHEPTIIIKDHWFYKL